MNMVMKVLFGFGLLALLFALSACSGTGPEGEQGKLPVRGNGPIVELTTGTSDIVRVGDTVSVVARIQNDGEEDLSGSLLQIKSCAALGDNADKVLVKDMPALRSGYIDSASLDGLAATIPDDACYVQANLCYLYRTVVVQEIRVNPLFSQKVTHKPQNQHAPLQVTDIIQDVRKEDDNYVLEFEIYVDKRADGVVTLNSGYREHCTGAQVTDDEVNIYEVESALLKPNRFLDCKDASKRFYTDGEGNALKDLNRFICTYTITPENELYPKEGISPVFNPVLELTLEYGFHARFLQKVTVEERIP